MAIVRDCVRISEGGRIVIPAAIRKALDVKVGDDVILELEDGVVSIRGRAHSVREAKRLAAKYKTEASAVEELIAERRAEAARE